MEHLEIATVDGEVNCGLVIDDRTGISFSTMLPEEVPLRQGYRSKQ
jgi:hypothetical protein